MRGGSDANYEADADGTHAGEDVRRALAGPIGEPGYGDGEDGCCDVDGDREELGGGGGVAEFADDGGEEEGGAVEWANYAPVHCIQYNLCQPNGQGEEGRQRWESSVTRTPQSQVYLPVRERVAHVFPLEVFTLGDHLA